MIPSPGLAAFDLDLADAEAVAISVEPAGGSAGEIPRRHGIHPDDPARPRFVAGDPRLDLVFPLIFIELDEGYQPNDSRVLCQLIQRGSHAEVLGLEDVYRAHYSFYFSNIPTSHPKLPARGPAHAEDSERWYDVGLYRWCVANLTRGSPRSEVRRGSPLTPC